jgi:hypothetical protein
MQSMNEERSEKKPYLKPEVKRYPLRPEEAVLGFCKTSASAGTGGSTCLSVGICKTQGS